jgi:hypothetical protein
MVENTETVKMEVVIPEIINAIAKRNTTRETPPKLIPAKKEFIQKNANIEKVPPDFQERYLNLMYNTTPSLAGRKMI